MYTKYVYIIDMIRTFADKETMKIYNQQFAKKLPHSIQRIALRKLIMINNALDVKDLLSPPGNNLEKLTGDGNGQYSIRINGQYRICFKFEEGDFFDVEITDYH